MARLQTEYKYEVPDADGGAPGYIILREPTNEEWNEFSNEDTKGAFLVQKPGQEIAGLAKMNEGRIRLFNSIFERCDNLVDGAGKFLGKDDIPNRMKIDAIRVAIIERPKKIESGN